MSTGAQVLIAVPLLLAIALLLFWSSRRADAQRRDRFIDRPPISNEEFLAECSINQTDQALVALALRQQIATSLAIPAEKISPNDRFDRELRPVKGWEHDDGLWILSKELADKVKDSNMKRELELARTVRDYIQLWLRTSSGKPPAA